MGDFLRSIRFKILIAILAVMVGFMIMAIYTGGTAPLFSQIVSMVTVPVQRFSAGVSDSVAAFFQRYTDAAALHDQNALLQHELNDARARLVDYEKIKHENNQLKEILGFAENRQDLAIKPASVIARDPNDRFYSFTIDKGSLDHISYLDPVITAEGLVGYVSEVGLAYAKVKTILDISVDVGVYDSTTRDVGVISGDIDLAEQGLCQMEYLTRDSKVAAGDMILTGAFTDAGSLFPKDVIVGQVLQVESSSHGTSLVAIVRPTADIIAVKDVFVITDFEGQAEK